MIFVKNIEYCTGCLICEMVCSFHHTRKYSRRHSSIRVNKSIFDRARGPGITIAYGQEKEGPVCDLCKGEDSPLCVRHCPEDVLGVEGKIS
jgi:Fe-S-cluster-containing hydrogenase component 2